jgi:hypothetical protein
MTASLLAVAFSVVAVDARSCFGLVAHRFGWWDVLCADRIARRSVTAALRRLCGRAIANPTVALDPAVWSRFGVTLVEVVPDGEPWPVELEDPQRPDGRMEVVPTYSPHRPLHFAWPDVVAAAVRAGRPPHIVRATRYVPLGRQSGIRRRLPVLPGLVLDSDEDPVLGLVRRRDKATADDDVTLAADLRVVTSSLVFGILSRADEVRHHHGRQWVTGERPGPWSCFPVVASVTAGARLLLAILDRLVGDRGGIVAYRDTDSSLIAAGPEGGLVALADGTRARALSWGEVDEILSAFAPLSPASWWPVWSVERGMIEDPLWASVFGAKRHVEFLFAGRHHD